MSMLVKVSLVSTVVLLGVIFWYLHKLAILMEIHENRLKVETKSFSVQRDHLRSNQMGYLGTNRPVENVVITLVPTLLPTIAPMVVAQSPAQTPFRQHGSLLSLSNHSVRNLIMGLSQQSNDESIAVFLGSLREHQVKADVVLFINSPVSDRCKALAQRWHAVIIEYTLGHLVPDFLNKYHASSLRWVLFQQYLTKMKESIKGNYEKIMFTDIRDVVFGGDPFSRLPVNKSYVFEEGVAPGTLISACGWNSGWIKDCFGSKMLAAVQNNPVICSGVSLMSFEQGSRYLRLMSGVLDGSNDLGGQFPRCERNGVDQGVHNTLIHLGLLPNLEVKTELDFPVVNIQSSVTFNVPGIKLESLRMNGFDIVTQRPFSSSMAVIHQYDRVASLTMQVMKRYVFWKNYDDVIGMWRAEQSCADYNTAVGSDLLKGVCDVGSARVSSPEQCCSLCKNLIKCMAFTFVESMCYFKSCSSNNVEEATAQALSQHKNIPTNWKLGLSSTAPSRLDNLILTAFI